ncbi:MAG: DUF2497 domain-containing protein [Caulobacteraceae bacterium]|nr:DUF2497 domain-containing protein [Caulobacteraceae bacterium]
MTDTTAQEPTMEEILASIRRIISEDDAPATEAAPAAEEPVADPEPIAAVEAAPAMAEEEVLELTERYEAPAVESIGDLDVSAHHEPEPEPFPTSFEPSPEPVHHAAPEPAAPVEALVGAGAAASAASAFAGLTASLARPEPATLVGGSGPTIDALARELLRPMLKEWLDANLPGIVEAAVRKEVERIARSAG